MRILAVRSAAFVILIAGAVSSGAERRDDGYLRQPGKAEYQAASAEPAVRAIDDPSAGVRWLLIPDPVNPAGPGLFIRTSPLTNGLRKTSHAETLNATPIIHAGDLVQVEEHTPVLDADLEAVALCTAAPGASLRVRLKVGGRVVRAIALAPGRALLGRPWEARP